MSKLNDKRVLMALAALSAFAAAACSTIAGAGEDIQDAGSAVTNAAEETQEEMEN